MNKIAISPEQVKNEEKMKEYLMKSKGKFPDLYKKAVLGNIVKVLIWRIRVIATDERTAIIRRFHGYYNNSGKEMPDEELTSEPPMFFDVGKNIGKINETTPYTQALSEAISMYLDKYKSYDPDFNVAFAENTVMISPMLALRYKNSKHNLIFPCAIQRKYDGDRCVSTIDRNGNVILYKRSMDRILSCDHIRAELKFLFNNKYILRYGPMYFDGEIYKHGLSLQKISGIIGKLELNSGQAEGLEYHIFDCFFILETKMPFKFRSGIIADIFATANVAFRYLRPVETIRIFKEDEILNYHQKFLSEGFEGTILRNEDSPYTFSGGKSSGRSHDLLKLKTNESETVIIKDIKPYDADKAEFGITLTVFDPIYGVTWDLNGNGSRDYRHFIFDNRAKFLGAKIMIEFIDRTEAKIPKFAYPKLQNGQYTFM